MYSRAPLRYAALSLVLALPVSALAQDDAAETQPDNTAATQDTGEVQAEIGFAEPVTEPAIPTGIENVSYSIGYKIGLDMSGKGVELDVEQLAAGIHAGQGQEEPRFTDDQIEQCLIHFQIQMQENLAQKNLDAGLAYLNENAQEEGVIVTDSGLQYRVIESGDADSPSPTLDDNVSARYRGTFIDGTVFDSSPEDEAVPFPVNRVIPGWIEALQLMKAGDKWELVIPSELAYRETGTMDGRIGPNQVLLFEIELVEILSADE